MGFLKDLVCRRPGESLLRFLAIRVSGGLVGGYIGWHIAPDPPDDDPADPECTCKRDCKKCYP